MDTKLTLKLDKSVIDNAKEYAVTQKRSLSRIIESYLKSLVAQEKSNSPQEKKNYPFVRSLSTGVSIPLDVDYKGEYSGHLAEKHQ